MFRRNKMIDANDTTFQEREKTLNGIRMTFAVDVLTNGMFDNIVFVEPTNCIVNSKFIAHYFATKDNFVRKERTDRTLVNVHANHSPNIPISFNNCKNGGLGFCASALRIIGSLRSMFIAFFATHVGLIDLHDVSQWLAKRFSLAGVSQAMQDKPSGFLRYADVLTKLKGTDTLLVGSKQIDGYKPFTKRNLAILENASNFCGKFLAAIGTLVMNAICEGKDFSTATMRAIDAVSPAHGFEMSKSNLFIGEDFG